MSSIAYNQLTAPQMLVPQKINQKSLKRIQKMFFRSSGIYIADHKEQLIINRLTSHMLSLGFNDFDEYCDYLEKKENEQDRLTSIDLLTTNETYFFREPAHFKYLKENILPHLKNNPVRVWCAAASSGEEPYSIAMELAEYYEHNQWELIASDISYRMLEKATAGLYAMQRLENMPAEYLKKYCRKGVSTYEGMLRVSETLRNKVKYHRHNLLDPADSFGLFDVIFVRNVMIYFDNPVKNIVLNNLCNQLKPGGWLITSHSESLGKTLYLKPEKPSIYRKVES
jgi:chemotaxis protein methyltransferase CheR